MFRLRRIPTGPWIVLGTLFLTAVVYIVRGDSLFSPGPLREVPTRKVSLGGVRSHAELTDRCSACHAATRSDSTMESLCLGCHTDVHTQIDRRLSLHGRLTDAESCRKCHTEHRGSQATLTDFTHFDHGVTAFPLTGKHLQTECSACHKNQVYQGTSRSCVACHAEPKVHLGRFGTDCLKCHSTVTWKGAAITAESHRFPIRHGGGKNRGQCVTCHTQSPDYRTYTCYGCHHHDPERTAAKHRRLSAVELQACAKCHPTGREDSDRRRDKTRGRDSDD